MRGGFTKDLQTFILSVLMSFKSILNKQLKKNLPRVRILDRIAEP